MGARLCPPATPTAPPPPPNPSPGQGYRGWVFGIRAKEKGAQVCVCGAAAATSLQSGMWFKKDDRQQLVFLLLLSLCSDGSVGFGARVEG